MRLCIARFWRIPQRILPAQFKNAARIVHGGRYTIHIHIPLCIWRESEIEKCRNNNGAESPAAMGRLICGSHWLHVPSNERKILWALIFVQCTYTFVYAGCVRSRALRTFFSNEHSGYKTEKKIATCTVNGFRNSKQAY